MNKILKRLIVFFIGIPFLFSITIFFPQQNHLLLNLVALLFSVLGAAELKNILAQKKLEISMPQAIVLGAIIPAASTLAASFGFTSKIVFAAFALGAFWVLISQVFAAGKKLDLCINHAAAGFTVMIYPGFFMSWIIAMSAFRSAGIVILFFMAIVFFNDAFAWGGGILFGKNSRGFIAVSPNKSIAGFIFGQSISIASGVFAVILFPELFSSKIMPPPFAGVLLGFLTGFAAILGDLCESAIKRSAGVKDSGTLILGRGGALDSIDSLALAAPVFYFAYRILFQA